MKIILRLSLFTFILAAAPGFATAQTAAPECSGRNIYTDLQKSDPVAFAAIEKSAAATLNAGPLFWKITPRNGAKPSYLLGTAHVTDSRIAMPPDRIMNVIKQSRVAVFELAEIMNRSGMSAALMRDRAHTRMPEGQSLWDIIPDDQEAALKTDPRIAKIPEDLVSRFQPWVIMTMISTPSCEEARKRSKFPLDAVLAQTAQIARVDIAGLETIAEQIEAISSASLPDQVEMLTNSKAHGFPVEDTFQTLTDLYVAERITVFMPLMEHLAQKRGIQKKPRDVTYENIFIIQRNKNMASRSKQYLDKGAAFIAVGALHLYGEEGVVELLRKAGYKVTPAK
jgi:uncharacterized protein